MTKPILGLTVIVENDRLDKAIRLFKKKVDDSGLLNELRNRETYVKPSIERKLKRNAAKKRWDKYVQSNTLSAKKY